MNDIQTQIARLADYVDVYCAENQTALDAGEEPIFYPVGFEDLADSGPAIAHCAIIETFK